VLILAQITQLVDLLRVSFDLFSIQFIITLRIVSLLQHQHHNTRKKRKFNKNAINSCGQCCC